MRRVPPLNYILTSEGGPETETQIHANKYFLFIYSSEFMFVGEAVLKLNLASGGIPRVVYFCFGVYVPPESKNMF